MLFDLSGIGTSAGNIWTALPFTIQAVYVLIAGVVVFKWCADCVMGVLDEVHAGEKEAQEHWQGQLDEDIKHGWGDSESDQYIRKQLDYEFSGDDD